MFEFDAGKLIIIGIVALIVIGPKELPRLMRQVGEAMAKMRRMAAEFRGQFLDAMRETDIDDIRTGVEKLAESSKPELGLDPLAQIKTELTQALEAAEKPAALPPAGATASAVARNGDLAIDSIASLPPPNTPETARPSTPEAVDGEMRALADALTAEIGEIKPVSVVSESTKAPGDR